MHLEPRRLLRALALPAVLVPALGCAGLFGPKEGEKNSLFDADGDGVAFTADCDDEDPDRSPDLPEVCDDEGKDEDCDGDADLDDDEFDDVGPWYPDEDGDGFGDDAGELVSCTQPDGYVDVGGDCDDGDDDISPAAVEVCDGADVDEDCNGLADDDDPHVDPDSLVTFYVDADGDGHGVPGETVEACDAGDGWADERDDCDDAERSVYPGRAEICDDGLDNDCDGTASGCGIEGEEILEDGADAMVHGTYFDDYLASAVVGCHLDGNARSDVVIASHNVGFSNEGEIYVFEGSFSGTLPSSDADSIITGYGYSQLGTTVTCYDTDGDGTDDVVSGAPGVYTFVGVWRGALAATESPEVIDAFWQEGDDLGDLLAHGDLDGDGQDDLLLGDTDTVWLAPGPIGTGQQLLADATLTIEGFAASEYDTLLAADVDGDGVDDLVYGDGYTNDGVWVVLGGVTGTLALTSEADRHWTGEADSGAGRSVAADDLDGDGTLDLLVGASLAGAGGEVYLVTGLPASGALADQPSISGSANERFGYVLAAPGDVTGDGVHDLLAASGELGDDGGVYLFEGPIVAGDSHDATAAVLGDQGGLSISLVAGVGDTDNDGTNDWVVGANRYNYGGDDDVGGVFLFLGGGM